MLRKRLFIFAVIFCMLSVYCTSNCFAQDYNFIDISTTKIETERLILTPTNNDDLDTLSKYLLDYDVTKYLDPSIEDGFRTKEEALEFLKSSKKNAITTSAEYTIKLKDSKIPIGKVDAMLYDHSIVLFSCWLGKDFQSKGYATEACCSLCNDIFNAQDVNDIEISCHFRNDNSKKLAHKIFDYIEQNNENLKLIRYEHRMIGTDMYRFILGKS